MLHFTLEHRDWTLQMLPGGIPGAPFPSPQTLSRGPIANHWMKVRLGLGPFWGDRFESVLLMQVALVLLLGVMAWLALRPAASPAPLPARTVRPKKRHRRLRRG
jgi:hypothetical protein